MTSLPQFAEIQRILADTPNDGLPPLRLSVLRNITVEAIEPYLAWLALESGFRAEIGFGAFDNILQETLGQRPDLISPQTDAVIVFRKLEGTSPDIAYRFAALTPAQVAAETERLARETRQILAGLRRQSGAMILWVGHQGPLHPALGLVDEQSNAGQAGTIAALNTADQAALSEIGNGYFIDADRILRLLGAQRFYDPRYWHMARAPYSREALGEMACALFRPLRALKGRNRKCLVLDCDNTLWGGIVGEDGLAGIRIGRNHPGSPYHEFQQWILNLHHRGVILALCSKNNEADVHQILDEHPEMVLRRRHIAAARINWRDKAANLREIAAELNIGLDSLAFVDDSDFETNLVRETLPEVAVLQLPAKQPTAYAALLAATGWFDTLTVSGEDRTRGAIYRAESERRQARETATDLEGFLRDLEMVVEIEHAGELTIPRIAQQTQKTNQFNLTTRRYDQGAIESLAHSEAADVLCLGLTDRFGDSGVVGTAIMRYDGAEAFIDSFLLSCRVLGRGVEAAFLAGVLAVARRRGARLARGRFIPTAKNGQVADFYERMGFSPAPASGPEAGGEGGSDFLLDLTGKPTAPPRHFKAARLDGVDLTP